MALELTDSFLAQAKQLQMFVERNGRLPVMCDAKDPGEKALGDFLRVQRRNIKRGTFGAGARKAWLDARIPAWLTEGTRANTARSTAESFDARVQKVARFRAEHGRLPRMQTSRREEDLLSRFLINQRQAKKARGTTAWSQTRSDALDAAIPGWEDTSANAFPLTLAA